MRNTWKRLLDRGKIGGIKCPCCGGRVKGRKDRTENRKARRVSKFQFKKEQY